MMQADNDIVAMYAVQLNGAPTNYRVTLNRNTLRASIDIVFDGKPYTLVLTQWQGRRMARFLEYFHGVAGRDAGRFGIAQYDAEGFLVGPGPALGQRHEAILQACQDVMSYIGRVIERHGGAILGYATWYTGQRHAVENYATFIQSIACEGIVLSGLHSRFAAEDIVI